MLSSFDFWPTLPASDSPELTTVDRIADLGDVERAARFRDSEGTILAISQFLTNPTG